MEEGSDNGRRGDVSFESAWILWGYTSRLIRRLFIKGIELSDMHNN